MERERRRERIKTHVSMRELFQKLSKSGCTNIISQTLNTIVYGEEKVEESSKLTPKRILKMHIHIALHMRIERRQIPFD